MSTDKSAAAIREFAEKCGWFVKATSIDMTQFELNKDTEQCLSDLTALISEHYVSKDEHEKMKHNLTHCGSCGDPLSRDCPRCKHLWET